MSGRPRNAPPPPHGTRARYLKHQRDHDVPCKECTRAQSDYTALWRQRRDSARVARRYATRIDLRPLIELLAACYTTPPDGAA